MDYSRVMQGDTLVISDEKQTPVLSIREVREGDKMLFALSGQMKNETAYEFEDELTAVLTVCTDVVVDLSELEFIASTGLSAFLQAQKTVDSLGGSIVLRGLSGRVLEAFENNGFTELFIIEEKAGGKKV